MSFDEKLITIRTYSTVSDAYIFKNILSNEGIESVVVDSNAPLTPAVPELHNGGVRLSVREGDVEQAMEVLFNNEKRVEDIDHLLM